MSRRVPLLLAAGTTLLALALAVAWYRSRTAPSIRLVDNRLGVDRLLAARANTPAAAPASGGLVREPVPEPDAQLLWTIDPEHYLYDPTCYFRHKPAQRRTKPWPEHPLGAFESRTSLDGYREDWDHLRTTRDLLVLVTGDSHTDGMCANEESFANRLERSLAARRPGQQIEVLNAGVAGYSLYHYLGVLERALELDPDAFVVAVYGGNDFLDVVRPWHYFHRTEPPVRTVEYWKRMKAAARANPVLVGNVLNQLFYFHTFPDQQEIALEASEQVAREIERVCAERAIALVWVFVPVAFSADEDLPAEVAQGLPELGLGKEDLRQFDRLADRFLAGLRERRNRVVDLREHAPKPRTAMYWSDWHIDLEGHEIAARALERELDPLFPP